MARPKRQPQLVRWVGEFLGFAADHAGYTFEQTLDLCLAEVGRRLRIKPRQVQVGKVSASTEIQASSALLLLLREVLRTDLEEIAQTVRAKRGRIWTRPWPPRPRTPMSIRKPGRRADDVTA